MPEDGQDEDYDAIMEEIQGLEQDLDEQLAGIEKELKYVTQC